MTIIGSYGTNLGSFFNKFFFGDSDKFRDSTFKLVPRIVKGNYVVKKAVGSKPTLLGKKLTQKYVRDDRFFEIMVDIGSSSIATKVVKLASGYVSVFYRVLLYSCS